MVVVLRGFDLGGEIKCCRSGLIGNGFRIELYCLEAFQAADASVCIKLFVRCFGVLPT